MCIECHFLTLIRTDQGSSSAELREDSFLKYVSLRTNTKEFDHVGGSLGLVPCGLGKEPLLEITVNVENGFTDWTKWEATGKDKMHRCLITTALLPLSLISVSTACHHRPFLRGPKRQLLAKVTNQVTVKRVEYTGTHTITCGWPLRSSQGRGRLHPASPKQHVLQQEASLANQT